MSDQSLKTKTTDALVDDIINAVNKAGKAGATLCEVTRALSLTIFAVNYKVLQDFDKVEEHVSNHLDEAYDEMVGQMGQMISAEDRKKLH